MVSIIKKIFNPFILWAYHWDWVIVWKDPKTGKLHNQADAIRIIERNVLNDDSYDGR